MGRLADATTAQEIEFFVRLALAALLGGMIGLERERSQQAAGLRTHMIVALGAALITIISIKIGTMYGNDRGRIAAQIVSGIGFLGAGAIMRYGTSVKGLTTAACLWTAAGIGMATGAGYYAGAAVATLLTLVATFVMGKLEDAIIGDTDVKKIVVVSGDVPGLRGKAEEILRRAGARIDDFGLEKDLKAKRQTLEFTTICGSGVDLEALAHELGGLPDVERIDIE
jgi:putative Mg2+ transporter-C (MgtC) family protein